MRRVVLVQLKRAYFRSGSTRFLNLHHRSGHRIYGQDFHQAQKMMFFSIAPVYWFATTSGVLEDEASLDAYSQHSNLHMTSYSSTWGTSEMPTHSEYFEPLLGMLGPAGPAMFTSVSASDIEEFYEYLYHSSPFSWMVRRLSRSQVQRKLDYVSENLPYQLFAVLRAKLQQFAFDNWGMPCNMGLFVCNAEDVYALSHSGRDAFPDLFAKSIPFSQFMLKNILAERFGDPNKALIDAVVQRDVSGFFRERMQEIADSGDFRVPDDIEETAPVRYSVVLSLRLKTGAEQG